MRRLQVHGKHGFRGLLVVLAVLTATLASAQILYPTPINHVIIVDQENRTVDNLFGSNSPGNLYYLPGVDVSTTGLAYSRVKGKKVVVDVPLVSTPLSSLVGIGDSQPGFDYDPGHSHLLWLNACDAPVKTDPSNMCAMDGFNHVTITCDAGITGCPGTTYPTYAYVQYSDVEPYFQIASEYGYANYMFQTNQGPTFPSHQFIFGGTSQPGTGVEPSWYEAENGVNTSNGYGCSAAVKTTVQLVNPATQDENTTMFPCFNHSTMADVFAAATPQITWTYYSTGPKSLLTAPNALQALCTVGKGVCTGPYWTKGKENGYIDGYNPADILTDISKCNLKQVSWVVPSFDHQRQAAALADEFGSIPETAVDVNLDQEVRKAEKLVHDAAHAATAAETLAQERAQEIPNVPEAEEALASAQQESERVTRLSGTLTLALDFLRRAEERVHRDIAPLLAAGLRRWLSDVTQGRYTDARVDPRNLSVQVLGPDNEWRDARQLSHGTAEQVYLLLRAVLAERLATTGETCPIILDDVLVQSDRVRKRALLDVIVSISRGRQVILLTQEEEVLRWAQENVVAPNRVVVLPGP